jgi:hypothetical protein
MYKADAFKHFDNNGAAIARALGLTRTAPQQWPEVVPFDKAYALQLVTRGKLKIDRSLYPQFQKRA